MTQKQKTTVYWAAFFAGALPLFAPPAMSLTLEFPGPATETGRLVEALGSYRLPIGPWSGDSAPTRLVEGAIDQTAWRIDAPGVGSLAIMSPLRQQLQADGWALLFECETDACGGYDFRYGMPVMTEPEMHVDLGEYRYLAAERGDEVISLLVSRSAVSGFVQMTRVGGEINDLQVAGATSQPVAVEMSDLPRPMPAKDLGQRLEEGGAVVLEDLVFASGASTLAEGKYASLVELAAYLAAHPERKVTVVGHTDASGSLEANVTLSRQRARSVRQRLIESYGLPADQIQADGVGYLAPRASNLTPEGQMQNRRVEVMLTSTQ